MINRWFCLALLGATLLSLTACGFQLRGQARLPEALNTVRLETTGQNPEFSQPLRDRLADLLRINGVTLSEQASTRIILSEVRVQRRTLATGVRGDAREFTLTVSAVVQVVDGTESVLLPPTTFNATRNLLYRETELLGLLEGEKLALRELTDELANAIMRRLQRL